MKIKIEKHEELVDGVSQKIRWYIVKKGSDYESIDCFGLTEDELKQLKEQLNRIEICPKN